MLPFAYELGKFDPTFPGITLHYPNAAAWEKVRETIELQYLLGVQAANARQRKRRGWGRLLRKPQIVQDPNHLLEMLLADPTIGNDLSSDQKEELGLQFIAADPEGAVANLAIASAFEHERRHFHDWLLSPYTAAINLIRSEVYLNYQSLRSALLADGTTVVPVPLLRWLRKSESEQQSLVEMWTSMLGDAVHIKLPDFASPGFQEAIEAIERRYRSIGMLFERVGATDADAAAVFEASALLIQIQSIHDIFGVTASNLFSESMGGLGRYRWFLQAMTGLVRPGEIPENDTLSAIAVWCLLGNSTADSANAHPMVRLNHAIRCVDARGFSKLDRPTGEILDELDKSSGVVPYRDLLEASIEIGDTTVRQLESLAEQEPSGSNRIAGIAQTLEFVHSLHVYMAQLFLRDPDIYCQPVQYLDRGPGQLPEPPFRETFGGPFRSLHRSNLDRYDTVKIFGDAGTPDDVFIRETVTQGQNGAVNLQIAHNWQYLCAATDTIFAESNRDSAEIATQKSSFKEDGVLCLEVLG